MASVRNRCPHCDAPSGTRSSREVSATAREIYFACSDVECGHTYVGHLVVVRSIRPSGKPNPRVHLPVGRLPSPSEIAACNDAHPYPANDDHQVEALEA